MKAFCFAMATVLAACGSSNPSNTDVDASNGTFDANVIDAHAADAHATLDASDAHLATDAAGDSNVAIDANADADPIDAQVVDARTDSADAFVAPSDGSADAFFVDMFAVDSASSGGHDGGLTCATSVGHPCMNDDGCTGSYYCHFETLQCGAHARNACGVCGSPVDGVGDECTNDFGCPGVRECNSEGTGTVCNGPSSCWCYVESDPDPEFTHDLLDVDEIAYIHPIGGAWGGDIRGHTYIGLEDGSEPVNLYAPVDMYLEAAIWYHYPDMPSTGDWGLRFRVSCEVLMRFGHITAPVEAITELWEGPPETDSRFWLELEEPMFFAAGDLIGQTTGTREAHNFDFGVFNTTVVHEFANQSRYVFGPPGPGDYSVYVNSDCPYNYFSDDLRPAYMSRLGNILLAAPVEGATCRSSMRDEVGTLAGTWFATEPVSYPYNSRLGIVSEFGGFAVVGGIANQIVDTDAVAPETVFTNHCYENDSEHVELSLVSEDELFVAHGSGACPVTPLSTPGGHTYVR